MGYNFVAADREQLMLMPPSVADWLPEDHLAWFVLDVVAELDLTGFLSGYRADGRGGAAYDPAMMLAVLVYAYCIGERSSRRIERRLVRGRGVPGGRGEPAARPRHDRPVPRHPRDRDRVVVRTGPRGVRPAGAAATGPGRYRRHPDGRQCLQGGEPDRRAGRRTDSGRGRRSWTPTRTPSGPSRRPGRAAPDGAGLGPRAGRRARLRRVLDELQAEADEHSYEAVMARRAAKEAETGKKIRGKRPSPDRQKNRGRQHGNITDPESRLMNTKDGFVQGFNAQAVATDGPVRDRRRGVQPGLRRPALRDRDRHREDQPQARRREAPAPPGRRRCRLLERAQRPTARAWSPSSHPVAPASSARSPRPSSTVARSSIRSRPAS